MSAVKNNKIGFLSCCRYMVFIGVTMVLFVAASRAKEITQEYSFRQSEISQIKIDDKMYDRIFLPGAPNSGEIGHPALPAYGVRILLPYGTEVTDIEVVAGEKIKIGTDFLIEPVEQPFVLSSLPENIPPLVLDSDIYSLNRAIPETKFEKVGIQLFRGYQILILKLYPVEYLPSSGTLYYYENLTLSIETQPSAKTFPALRQVAADQDQVKRWIDNPAELSSYVSADKTGRADYDMLIITIDAFTGAFQPLIDYHNANGLATEIHTLSQIGASDPHSIRDYIRQEFLNNGIQYVIIGADDDFIPALDMYVKSWESPTAIYEYDMPGDIYFSCLDGPYNYDNDAYWGEPTDGEGGGDIDLLPEIHLGRFTANTAADVTNLVNKTLAYAASQAQYLDRILISGENLGFGGMGEYGGYAMDEMVNGSDAHGFLTYAFPESEYDIEKLYDLLSMPYNYWYASEMIARINYGYHIIDHLGHSNDGYAMRTDTTMIKNQLTNTEYCFVYAEGCNAGKFDIPNCWAEYMTTKLSHGAFGCVANSRVGLGSRSTAHPVHVFNREFWDAVYDADEALPEIGGALTDTRFDHAYHINDPGIRWNFYEINLFGDPAITIKSVQSLAIRFPSGVPEHVIPYTTTSFDVTVSGIGSGEPIPGSGQMYYRVNNGDLETSVVTETSPGSYEAGLPPVGCDDTISYYVGIEESGGVTYFSPDPASPFIAVAVTDTVTIFEDDFETDQGWTVSGGLWERGVPTGQGGEELQYPVPDPAEGCNGPNVFGYNLNGDYENNLPARHITSPVIDCKDYDNVYLRFCRWLGVEQPVYDQAKISVSNNGIDWVDIWGNYAIVVDLEWMHLEYDISAVAADQETVYLRWVMGPTDGGLRYIGWNIDDVRVVSYVCQGFVCGDVNNDEICNILDITYIIEYLYLEGSIPDPIQMADVNSDGAVNILDVTYLIEYMYLGGPEPDCP